MKHIAPQPDLPGTEQAFNLAGQTIQQDRPQPAPVVDTQTREFAGIHGTFYVYEKPEGKL